MDTPVRRFIRNVATPEGSGGMRRISTLPLSASESTVHNDELERSNRRSDADMKRRLSQIPAPALSYSEIQQQVQQCIQLFADNKITAKNAWQIQIIDYLKSMFNSKESVKDSFQITTSSLDVCTKIYGIRVDDIHTEGLKLAHSVGKMQIQEDDVDEAVENENLDDDEIQQKKKEKKMKKKKFQKDCFIKPHETFLEDLHKIDSSGMAKEATNAESFPSSTIPLKSIGYKFADGDSSTSWLSCDNVDPLYDKFKNIEVKCDFPTSYSDRNPFHDFEVDEWDANKENELLAHSFPNNEVVYSDDGIPLVYLDGSIHDGFAEMDNDPIEEEDVIAAQRENNREIIKLIDFEPELNTNVFSTEYSYVKTVNISSNKFITHMWAGPSHWKLKYVKSATSRTTGPIDNQRRKPVRRAALEMDLINFMDDVEFFYNNNKCKKILRHHLYEVKRVTLPQQGCMDKDFRCLDSHPVPLLKMVPKTTKDVVQNDVAPYEYENLNDSQYCAQNNGEEGLHDSDGSVDHEAEFEHRHDQKFGENLVDAPEMVDNIYVHYAAHAKKMDMKKLKLAIWNGLVQPNNAMISGENIFGKEVVPTTFAKLYQDLPTMIEESMRKELSCHLSFVALLHLANDHNLQLTQHKDLHDFEIRQTKS